MSNQNSSKTLAQWKKKTRESLSAFTAEAARRMGVNIETPITRRRDSAFLRKATLVFDPITVARVAQDYLLSALKTKGELLAGIPGIDGIRLDMRIPYKDFVERFASEQYDELAIYSNLDDVKKFAEAEITNQELLDRSVVIVNGNRVKVSLDQAK